MTGAGRSSDTISFLLAKAAEVEDLLRDDCRDSDGISCGTAEDDEVVGESLDTDEEEEEEEDCEDHTSDEDKQFQAEFKAHKRNYYMEKLEYNEVNRFVCNARVRNSVIVGRGLIPAILVRTFS